MSASRGVTLGSTTVISRDFLNEKLRPLNVLRRGNEEYVFPLSIPAPITSLFGWRMHPIYQSWRFHSGTDLAAPEGTPVLATRSGRVAISDHLGGYGLTVILRHDEEQLESRYAHLSRIAVRPGEWVEQGEVIGLVGNTGTSTGPHLHFEMRQLTEQGWVAVDAQEVLEYGIANLLQIINNPLMALGQDGKSESADDSLLQDYPFRPGSTKCQLMDKGFTVGHRVRFHETDAAGVVYFANGLAICHGAYEASLSAVGIDLAQFFSPAELAYPVVRATIDFWQPMRCGDALKVWLQPQRLDGSTFEVEYQIFSRPTRRRTPSSPCPNPPCLYPDPGPTAASPASRDGNLASPMGRPG